MTNQSRYATPRRLALAISASLLLAMSMIVPTVQAATDGMERRQDRRDDRQDCRHDEGVGKDKRDCKQEERQDRGDGDDNDGDDKEVDDKEVEADADAEEK